MRNRLRSDLERVGGRWAAMDGLRAFLALLECIICGAGAYFVFPECIITHVGVFSAMLECIICDAGAHFCMSYDSIMSLGTRIGLRVKSNTA